MAGENKEVVFVRIRPNDKKQRVRSYSVFGLRFVEAKWYKLDRFMTKSVGGIMKRVDIAEYMREAKNEHAPDASLIFDVVDSQGEAEKIISRERAAAEGRDSVSSPIDFTAAGTATGDESDVAAAPVKRRPGRPRKTVAVAQPSGEGSSPASS